MDNPSKDPIIGPEPPDTVVSWVIQRRVFRGYVINEQELLTLSSAFTSMNLFFMGLTFGALISFGISLITTSFGSPFIFSAFIAIVFVSIVLTFYFAVAAIRDQKRANELVRQIRERS